MSSKVTDFGTTRKLTCDFLLVINSSLHKILHCFRDIAFERSKIAIFGYLSRVYPLTLTEGFPSDYLRKILPAFQQMAKVANGVETLPKISANLSRAHERYRRQTDDRQTDGRRHNSRSLKNYNNYCILPADSARLNRCTNTTTDTKNKRCLASLKVAHPDERR